MKSPNLYDLIKSLALLLILQLFAISNIFACLSITDELNTPNPSLDASFNLQPDVSPFTDCWEGSFKIRSNKNNWRLVASRIGPSPTTASQDSSHNIMANDLTLDFTLQGFGMIPTNGAILVSPFSSQTDLSSIQSGTFIVNGIRRSSNNCSIRSSDFYKLTKKLCLFRDFIFNIGNYTGQVSYLLIAP